MISTPLIVFTKQSLWFANYKDKNRIYTKKIQKKISHVESAEQRRFRTKVAWTIQGGNSHLHGLVRNSHLHGAKFALAWHFRMNSTKCEICHFELLIRMAIYHYRYLICQQFQDGFECGILERWFCTMNKIEPPKVIVHGYKNCFIPLFFLFSSLLYLACLNDPKNYQNTKTSHKYD